MKRIIALSFATLLAGCAVSHETYSPDGRRAYSIDCSGMAMSWGACYEKAGDICKGDGYDVLAGGSENGRTAAASGGNFFTGPVMKRSMLVACRRPPS
jgi:hypothetical protein